MTIIVINVGEKKVGLFEKLQKCRLNDKSEIFCNKFFSFSFMARSVDGLTVCVNSSMCFYDSLQLRLMLKHDH